MKWFEYLLLMLIWVSALLFVLALFHLADASVQIGDA